VANSGSILLAEDNADDVFLFRLAFKRAGFDNPVIVVSDGEQVVQYLTGNPPYNDRNAYPFPQLLLLDLKMPKLSGLEVLAWLRGQSQWRALPVLILTTSSYGPEIKQGYELGANSFLTKPADLEEFILTLKQTGEFWLRRSQLPDLVAATSVPVPEKPRGQE
jgi:CheY-like chemotaxis protein